MEMAWYRKCYGLFPFEIVVVPGSRLKSDTHSHTHTERDQSASVQWLLVRKCDQIWCDDDAPTLNVNECDDGFDDETWIALNPKFAQ